MPVGHENYYGFQPGCCRVCSGCNDPWNCQEMKCHICLLYELDEFSQRGICTYIFQPKTVNEKLRGMLAHATKHFNEVPPKSREYYLNLSLDNPEWAESTLFLSKKRLEA